MFFSHICFHSALGKELEASRGQCAFGLCDLAWCKNTHKLCLSLSPMGHLTQAVHTKNSLQSIWHTHTHMCWNTHALIFFLNFLSVSAATTNVRWAVSTPKGAGWTPVITCLRSSGTQAARWSHSTSRPQVPQHTTWDLWPHTHPYKVLHIQQIHITSTHAQIQALS